MSSRSRCLSRWNGEAFRLSISFAPASRAWAIGPGNQMSSQMVTRDRHALDLHHARLAARLEIAFLVEYPVIRQMLLAVAGQQLAIGDHRRRVVALAVFQPRVADHHIDAAHLVLQAAQALLDAQLHARTQQQVLGRIAAQRQFGEQDEHPPATGRGRCWRPRSAAPHCRGYRRHAGSTGPSQPAGFGSWPSPSDSRHVRGTMPAIVPNGSAGNNALRVLQPLGSCARLGYTAPFHVATR